MATCKPHQHAHLANGIRRIKQAIKNCDLPVSDEATIFKSLPIKTLNAHQEMWDDLHKQAVIDFYETAKWLNLNTPRL